MGLEPYQYRPATPTASETPVILPDSSHSRNTSGSSLWSRNSSPDSVLTHVTTPSRSPVRQLGPPLLPRIRTQDQNVESTMRLARTHRRALSSTVNPPGQPNPSRPTVQRSTTTPPECVPLLSPVSATSTASSWAFSSALNSPMTLSSYTRRPGHTRASSASIIDDNMLRQYGYPTYRSSPQYISRSEYTPSVVPGASTFVPPPQTAPAQPQDLAQELQYVAEDDPSINLTQYLTGPTPPVNLVPQGNIIHRTGHQMHSWWDIRNLKVWEGFDLETIKAIPDFDKFLSVDIRANALPTPVISQSRLQPQTEAQLTTIYKDFYATKVNNALKIFQGHQSHISMRAEKTKDGPDFIANYQNDYENTIAGNGRGRVVGLVMSFDRWNTGMRREVGHRKIFYLTALAHLHRCMREHSCRYGFIMTEIELVCVRAGTEAIPYFGFLELAPTIELKTQEGLTACMALLYLHMLAKNTPLPGQCGWKLEVGPPSGMTRTKVMEDKDDWIPAPQSGEKRNAKLARGWVMPGDPWNKKKEGVTRRR
ncbi:hypothetical protein MMC29_006586 [Sticta canariensis]|nr:hypothetical protein [Sticta canariensis]